MVAASQARRDVRDSPYSRAPRRVRDEQTPSHAPPNQVGDLKVEVFCDTAPATSFNFLALCASGHRAGAVRRPTADRRPSAARRYYDGSPFHRVIRGFMVQTGDPTGSGKGGASIWGGAFGDEFHAENRHDRRGVLAMANKGPGTNRSQFFFTFDAQPHLNDRYTVFGRLIDGFDALDALEKLPVGKKNRPTTDVRIERVTIHANPLAERDVVFASPPAGAGE